MRPPAQRMLLAALATAWPVAAVALEPDRAITQYVYDALPPRSGGPQGTITAIVQTPDGYLWLGTESEGIFRFDGARFVHDREFDKVFGRAGYRINGLTVGSDGALWVAADVGVARLSQAQWTAVLRERTPGQIAFTSEGELLVANLGRGLVRVRGSEAHTLRVPGFCGHVVVGHRGETWAAGPEGLWRIQGDKVTAIKNKKGRGLEMVAALHFGQSGDLWVATRAGLYRVRDGGVVSQLTQRDGLPSTDVTAVLEDRHGSVWIGTGANGLARLHAGQVQSFGEAQGLPNGAVTAFHEDREGNLWVATRRGLCRFTAGRFIPYGRIEGLALDRATSMVAARDGSVWIWCDGGGLTQVKGGRVVRVYTARDGLASDFGGPLFESRDGSIWVGHDRGISRLRDGRATAFRKGPIGKGYVPFVTEDADGILTYVFGRGLVRFHDGTVSPFPFREGSALPLGTPPYMTRWARDGTLWLATERGVWTLRDRLLKKVWDLPTGLSRVAWIHEDAAGVIWLATWEGLYRVQGRAVVAITTEQGLPHNQLTHLLEDGQGYFWISSPRGIFRVSRQALEEVAEGRRSRVDAEVFGPADGLRSAECNGAAQPSGCVARDGRLWFATNAGAVVVDPNDLKRNTLPPPVFIEDVVVDGQSRGASPGVRFEAGTTHVDLRYTALSLVAPEKVRFKAQLAGLDSGWVESAERVAHYTRLPPGRYRFRVIAANNDGVWNDVGASLDVWQLPHFYQTSWFLALVGLTLASAVAAAHHLRVRRHVRSERELQERVAAALADVKTLRGLLPICAWCKKVRDDRGYWNQIEEYVSAHSQAAFSHGICPECKDQVLQSGCEGTPEQ